MRRFRLLGTMIALLGLATTATAYADTPEASSNVAWLDHVDTPSSVTGLAFVAYPGQDVMFGDGVFGLRAWSLRDPAHPKQIGELPAAALALPGDDVSKGFWEGEHLQADPVRKL